ncbi:17571_t:CDS:2 [Gigaspora margarita]|uniref:17571_t:CDS:1 n=1 Tax=Gigaspora margarita TaxID=4874 RepID=A0ABN7VJ75_GIGMA|nr:17571_t:CDS:2 [Gigaspora margarita]
MYQRDGTLHTWPGLGLRNCEKHVLMLLSESERCDQPDSKYLKLINLTENEWQLLDSLILLLKPFYNATTVFSGSNYPIFNLIYPTMKLLIKKFEPSDGQSENDYADLLFGPREQISNQSQFIANKKNSSESDIEYEFETPSILEQIRKPLHASQGQKKNQRKAKKNTFKQHNDSRFKNCRLIEPLITSLELHNLVKAASYLSLQEYWEVSDKIRLILCSEEEYYQPLIEEISNDNFAKSSSISISNNFMPDLYSNEEPDSISKESEIDRYINKPNQKRKYYLLQTKNAIRSLLIEESIEISSNIKIHLINDLFWQNFKHLHNFLEPFVKFIYELEEDVPLLSAAFLKLYQLKTIIHNNYYVSTTVITESIRLVEQCWNDFLYNLVTIAAYKLDPQYYQVLEEFSEYIEKTVKELRNRGYLIEDNVVNLELNETNSFKKNNIDNLLSNSPLYINSIDYADKIDNMDINEHIDNLDSIDNMSNIDNIDNIDSINNMGNNEK